MAMVLHYYCCSEQDLLASYNIYSYKNENLVCSRVYEARSKTANPNHGNISKNPAESFVDPVDLLF